MEKAFFMISIIGLVCFTTADAWRPQRALVSSSEAARAFFKELRDLVGDSCSHPDVVRAACYGFDREDSTLALQSAINTGAAVVLVENVENLPWFVTPIRLNASHQTIVFEQGVTVVAKPGEFHDTSDCLFTMHSVRNVTLYGYGVSLLMQKSDYANTSLYNHSEHRHGLAIYDSHYVSVYSLVIAQTGGDGVYISGSQPPSYASTHIYLSHVSCSGNYRQGMSVISAQDLLVENCKFLLTNGTAPQAGVDLEPNMAKQSLSGVRFVNCSAKGNSGSGFQAWLRQLDSTTEPIDITFEGCSVDGGSSYAFEIGGLRSGLQGGIQLTDCTASATSGPGLGIVDKTSDSAAITVSGGMFVGVATETSASQSPIQFIVRSASLVAGNLNATDLNITDQADRPYMAGGGPAGVTHIHFQGVSVSNKNGCTYNLTKPQVDVIINTTCSKSDFFPK